ncbi:MAG: ATP-binding protein [Chloroflexi bacterium]|uniref:ATP-binding protein n=3 Tax=Candidatus Chlorohelix allophototropha TaxID=3003348 RepID=A0A8T7LZX9_9CHLR|nr:ATP-binding protein [Chloroflexota bacterium]
MDAQVGDPNFGRIIPCGCKIDEQLAGEFERLKKLSNLDAFRNMTFENFNRLRGVRENFEISVQYARDPNGWLLFFGNFGTGKTHLAAAIANYALRNLKMKVYFTAVPDLLDYLRASFDPNSTGGSYDDRFEEIKNVPLLILDDLGTENASPWAREKLYQLINHRYNLKLPTVFTTNVDMDMLDGRIRSRIGDAALCRLVLFNQADDYRQLPPEHRDWTRTNQGVESRGNKPQNNTRVGNNTPPTRRDHR